MNKSNGPSSKKNQQRKRKCKAVDCQEMIPLHMCFCEKHYKMIPERFLAPLVNAWKTGNRGLQKSKPYLDAFAMAVFSIQKREFAGKLANPFRNPPGDRYFRVKKDVILNNGIIGFHPGTVAAGVQISPDRIALRWHGREVVVGREALEEIDLQSYAKKRALADGEQTRVGA